MTTENLDFIMEEIAAELGVTLEQYRQAHRSVARRFGVNIDTTVAFLVPTGEMTNPAAWVAQNLTQQTGMERRFASTPNELAPQALERLAARLSETAAEVGIPSSAQEIDE